MAFSTDSDLVNLIPDILDLGIASFSTEHSNAENDIIRELRIGWWDKKGLSGELNKHDYFLQVEIWRRVRQHP